MQSDRYNRSGSLIVALNGQRGKIAAVFVAQSVSECVEIRESQFMAIRLLLVAGARPNFMKIAPLMEVLCRDPDFASVLVHTGQHYDYNMSGQFFSDLGLPAPCHHLEVGSGTHAQQTAEIMKRLESVTLQEQPAAIVVVGDVNSTVAGALVAKKLGISVVHVEAGLRSFDRSMPEEINRIVTDSIADVLLVTEESGRVNLLREGVAPDSIYLVGNLMIDSLRRHLDHALKSNILDELRLSGKRFGLVTMHRPANVDDPSQFAEIIEALRVISCELPLCWPVHPRTRARMEDVSLPQSIKLLDPLGYLDFLCLQAHSAVVLTDSGGIQEETTVLGIPCLTLRDNTERPVTIECGTNVLAGTSTISIIEAWKRSVASPKIGVLPPLWDGMAGIRCHRALRHYFGLLA
jgi:UDP-N-acetylglucosamine 2-epimerase (non-hydrolysing)